MKGIVIFYLLLVLAMIGGWVENIVKLIGMVGGTVNAKFILRVIGVFLVPFGGVMGVFVS